MINEQNKKEILTLIKEYCKVQEIEPISISLYGSRVVSPSSVRPDSDWDVAIQVADVPSGYYSKTENDHIPYDGTYIDVCLIEDKPSGYSWLRDYFSVRIF